VVSPLLLNVALHGMEQAAGVRYRQPGVHAGETVPGSTVVIRYADDLVALCYTNDKAEQVKARLANWLAPRVLTFNEDKTRNVTLDKGFDFLGSPGLSRTSTTAALAPRRARISVHSRSRIRLSAALTRFDQATPFIPGKSLRYVIPGGIAGVDTLIANSAGIWSSPDSSTCVIMSPPRPWTPTPLRTCRGSSPTRSLPGMTTLGQVRMDHPHRPSRRLRP
jgi:RNA-directed DNA polymerase